MTFKAQFQNRLEGDAHHDELVEMVRQYKAAGLGQREIYNQLQELRVEYGFDNDDHDQENPIRDNLEFVMEVVWGFCPASRRIWESSLSTQNQPS